MPWRPPQGLGCALVRAHVAHAARNAVHIGIPRHGFQPPIEWNGSRILGTVLDDCGHRHDDPLIRNDGDALPLPTLLRCDQPNRMKMSCRSRATPTSVSGHTRSIQFVNGLADCARPSAIGGVWLSRSHCVSSSSFRSLTPCRSGSSIRTETWPRRPVSPWSKPNS